MTVLCRKNICVKASQMVWHQYEPFFQHLLPLVQSLSPVWLCNPMKCSMPGFPVLHYLLEFSQIHVHCVDDAIQTSLPLLPSSPPTLNLSEHRVFSSELALHIRWPKYWSLSSSVHLSNEYSGLISFKIDWFDLLAVQGTLKSLLQHHRSILQRSAFFITQLSHPYVTNGKTIALTRRTFAGKVMSLLFNLLSRLVIAFLPRNKRLLISWLQSPLTVILEPPSPPGKSSLSLFPLFPHPFAMKWLDRMPWS